MDPWNPILNSSMSQQIVIEETHAKIRDRVSVAIMALVSSLLILGWAFGL
jgi:hypothetical protein